VANILWCESPSTDDCLATGEWDLMVAYIKHSAVTDFTIYGTEGTCVDTGQAFKFSQSGVISQMYGGADAWDAMRIFANDSDSYPFIHLAGGSDISLEVAEGDEILFKGDGNTFFTFDHTAAKSHLYGGATTGDDLLLYANTINDCSMIELCGNSGITCKVKATNIFEVATCSDETLFEIDSAAGNHHMHFHCLDACDFVLENRTGDPGSPCTGQIWFRTDLV
jgi:hypothetical protein